MPSYTNEYLKAHPSLRHYLQFYPMQAGQLSSHVWDNIVEHFFPADQKEKATEVTEENKEELITYRRAYFYSTDLVNTLSRLENDIVNAHRLPYPNNSKVDLDPAIRADNRKYIAEFAARSDDYLKMLKDEIALICRNFRPFSQRPE